MRTATRSAPSRRPSSASFLVAGAGLHGEAGELDPGHEAAAAYLRHARHRGCRIGALREVDADQTLVVRMGYGEGEQVCIAETLADLIGDADARDRAWSGDRRIDDQIVTADFGDTPDCGAMTVRRRSSRLW